MSTSNILNLQKLVDHLDLKSKERKASGMAMLTGQQWVVVQDFGHSYKIIGFDENYTTISGTIDYFESRSFAGIIYYDESRAREVAEQLNNHEVGKIAKYLAFNPYRNTF